MLNYSELSKPQRYVVDTIKFYDTDLLCSLDTNDFYIYDKRFTIKVNKRTAQSLIDRNYVILTKDDDGIKYYSLNKDITYPKVIKYLKGLPFKLNGQYDL
jgi:hypothetical protein